MHCLVFFSVSVPSMPVCGIVVQGIKKPQALGAGAQQGQTEGEQIST